MFPQYCMHSDVFSRTKSSATTECVTRFKKGKNTSLRHTLTTDLGGAIYTAHIREWSKQDYSSVIYVCVCGGGDQDAKNRNL